MLTLSKSECIARIKRHECFHASVENNAFEVKVEEYAPIVCTAIHNGNNLRTELEKNFLLNDAERLYEEDPYTADVVSSFPIVLTGNDSRFEYDLNRAKTLSTYFKTAWNKQVWAKSLSPTQRNKSHLKHQAFYDVLEALIEVLESKFKSAIVFDIHSYNYKRIEADTPTFNIGTSQIDNERWGNVVTRFEKELNKIELPNLQSRAAIDEVFQGRGYLITHVNSHFDNTLVIPTEIKKVFMEEETGELYPLVLEELKTGVKEAISETAAFFMRRFGKKRSFSKSDVLSSVVAKEVTTLDKRLFELCKNIETLNYINPINLASEKKRFFAKKGQYEPEFRYKQLNIDPYYFREALYKLPVSDVLDADIQQLYRHVIDNLATKIDLLTAIGTENFKYNSLKYYGEPSKEDLANANFLIHAPTIAAELNQAMFDANAAARYFKEKAKQWQLNCKIETSNKIVAKAMVNSAKKQLLINKDAQFTQSELEAFAYHELGIHMLTTINSKAQPLKVFSLGLVGNTMTQEGLAIFSEYCSGHLTLNRLKSLALRVVAVNLMLEQNSFAKTFHTLVSDYDMDEQTAFTMTTRVYRGGGFTKDYLYLRGFSEVLKLSDQQAPLEDLLVGKTGLLDFSVISEMIDRGMLAKPKPLFDLSFARNQPVLDYLVSAIKF